MQPIFSFITVKPNKIMLNLAHYTSSFPHNFMFICLAGCVRNLASLHQKISWDIRMGCRIKSPRLKSPPTKIPPKKKNIYFFFSFDFL